LATAASGSSAPSTALADGRQCAGDGGEEADPARIFSYNSMESKLVDEHAPRHERP